MITISFNNAQTEVQSSTCHTAQMMNVLFWKDILHHSEQPEKEMEKMKIWTFLLGFLASEFIATLMSKLRKVNFEFHSEFMSNKSSNGTSA